MMRHDWINKADADKVALRRQCVLASVCRATLYARQKPRAPVPDDEIIKRLIDEEYTSRPHPQHKVYSYLLRGVAVTQPNQVWSTDITYIRLARH